MIDKDHILQLIKNSVKATAPGATLILYGSYARGDYRDDSDIDVIVLLDKDKVTLEDRKKITSPLYRIELEIGRVISLFFSPLILWETTYKKTPFYDNVSREGILL